MPFPKVCVIVLNWNTWQVTCDCLHSLKRVEYPNLEIVLVDNGSANDSAEQLAARFPEIPLIRNDVNRGFAGGNNVAIRRALQHGADYVLLLNNDTVVSPRSIVEMVTMAESDPDLALVSPKIHYFDSPYRVWYAGGTFSLWRGIAHHIGLGREDNARYEQPKECTFATGCALLARADFIREAGYLDENFFMVCEDTDWCVRAMKAGYLIGYAPAAVIWHKESYTIRYTSGKWLRDYYNIRNSLLIARKHAQLYHWPTLTASLAALLIYRTVGYCVRREWDRVGALYRGLRDGLTCRLSSDITGTQVETSS